MPTPAHTPPNAQGHPFAHLPSPRAPLHTSCFLRESPVFLASAPAPYRSPVGEPQHTTGVVQQYLNELHGESPAEPIVRELLARSVARLQMLCASMLFRDYPRLTRPPLNLQPEELLSSLLERLIKALRQARPPTVRQFFGLANQHIRWELNDLARRLDNQTRHLPLDDNLVPAPPLSESGLSPNTRRILDAIDGLPTDEREVFELVRIGGMTHAEAADIVGITERTVHRRLTRALILLTEQLGDLRPQAKPHAPPAEGSAH